MKILVIDDDQDILDLATYMLELDGHEVTTAVTGEKGYDMVNRVKPDLILLDIMLPGIDGFQVCKKIKRDKRFEHIPIFMFTALNMISDIELAFQCGADDYIAKPFDRAQLNKIIQKKMEKNQGKQV